MHKLVSQFLSFIYLFLGHNRLDNIQINTSGIVVTRNNRPCIRLNKVLGDSFAFEVCKSKIGLSLCNSLFSGFTIPMHGFDGVFVDSLA